MVVTVLEDQRELDITEVWNPGGVVVIVVVICTDTGVEVHISKIVHGRRSPSKGPIGDPPAAV